MTRKKILFIHHGKGLGGAPLSLLYLIKALDKTKYEPMVLFLHDSDALRLYKEQGITVYGPAARYDFPHTKIWWLRWYSIGMLTRVFWDTFKTRWGIAQEWYAQLKPDIVHLNTSSLIAWGYVAHQIKIPVVWHIREPLAEGYFGIRKWLITRSVEKYADAIVPICHDNAQPWKKNPKTIVVYNAVPADMFTYKIDPTSFLENHHLKSETPKILFLGGLSQEKGTLVILNVFEQLLQRLPTAQLLLAGYFELTKPSTIKNFFGLEAFQKNVVDILNRVNQSVVLLGPIKEVPRAMAACNVVVFPATIGHFARPIIEAGFMKKPVVASNLKPLDELIINRQTGFLIDPTNVDEWAEKLGMLLQDREFNTKMGQAHYDFCLRHFGIKNQIEKIEKIYDSLKRSPSS